MLHFDSSHSIVIRSSRVSRAPSHHTLPTFLSLNGTKRLSRFRFLKVRSQSWQFLWVTVSDDVSCSLFDKLLCSFDCKNIIFVFQKNKNRFRSFTIGRREVKKFLRRLPIRITVPDNIVHNKFSLNIINDETIQVFDTFIWSMLVTIITTCVKNCGCLVYVI